MEITLTKNSNDELVYAFIIRGMTIFNPMMSECGRFKVNPSEVYGLNQKQVKALHDLNKAFGYDDTI